LVYVKEYAKVIAYKLVGMHVNKNVLIIALGNVLLVAVPVVPMLVSNLAQDVLRLVLVVVKDKLTIPTVQDVLWKQVVHQLVRVIAILTVLAGVVNQCVELKVEMLVMVIVE
jgi:hypothetical protein